MTLLGRMRGTALKCGQMAQRPSSGEPDCLGLIPISILVSKLPQHPQEIHMPTNLSRRDLFQAGAGAILLSAAARRAVASAPVPFGQTFMPQERSTVSLIKGEYRRKTTYE